jgi:hypothetical protein
MKQSKVKELSAKGARVSVDNKNPQQRQVIATAGKLRVQVKKGADRGKANN